MRGCPNRSHAGRPGHQLATARYPQALPCTENWIVPKAPDRRPEVTAQPQAVGHGSADHQDGPVGEVDHLVCRAAQHKAGQVTVTSRAHHDDASIVGTGGVHDLAPRLPVDRGPHFVVSLDAGIVQLLRGGAAPAGQEPGQRGVTQDPWRDFGP
jgi:hypothetical protein